MIINCPSANATRNREPNNSCAFAKRAVRTASHRVAPHSVRSSLGRGVTISPAAWSFGNASQTQRGVGNSACEEAMAIAPHPRLIYVMHSSCLHTSTEPRCGQDGFDQGAAIVRFCSMTDAFGIDNSKADSCWRRSQSCRACSAISKYMSPEMLKLTRLMVVYEPSGEDPNRPGPR